MKTAETILLGVVATTGVCMGIMAVCATIWVIRGIFKK
jgi:hypothetical protein